jgi:hypothetical protein
MFTTERLWQVQKLNLFFIIHQSQESVPINITTDFFLGGVGEGGGVNFPIVETK